MVVHDFDLVRPVRLPAEANAPLVVDADGVSAFAVALEGFQTVSRRHSELQQIRDGVELGKLPQGGTLDVRRKSTDFLPPEQPGGVVAGKGTDHALRSADSNGWRYEQQDGNVVTQICPVTSNRASHSISLH